MPTIYPTGTCFDDTMEFIAQMLVFCPEEAKQLVLVHAICLGPDGSETSTCYGDLKPGKPFAHAWVENIFGGCICSGVLDGKKGYFIRDVVELHASLRIQKMTRYTMDEVIAMNTEHETFGPWEPEYIALCRGGEKFHESGKHSG